MKQCIMYRHPFHPASHDVETKSCLEIFIDKPQECLLVMTTRHQGICIAEVAGVDAKFIMIDGTSTLVNMTRLIN